MKSTYQGTIDSGRPFYQLFQALVPICHPAPSPVFQRYPFLDYIVRSLSYFSLSAEEVIFGATVFLVALPYIFGEKGSHKGNFWTRWVTSLAARSHVIQNCPMPSPSAWQLPHSLHTYHSRRRIQGQFEQLFSTISAEYSYVDSLRSLFTP